MTQITDTLGLMLAGSDTMTKMLEALGWTIETDVITGSTWMGLFVKDDPDIQHHRSYRVVIVAPGQTPIHFAIDEFGVDPEAWRTLFETMLAD